MLFFRSLEDGEMWEHEVGRLTRFSGGHEGTDKLCVNTALPPSVRPACRTLNRTSRKCQPVSSLSNEVSLKAGRTLAHILPQRGHVMGFK